MKWKKIDRMSCFDKNIPQFRALCLIKVPRIEQEADEKVSKFAHLSA
jgi:hypothetical protein